MPPSYPYSPNVLERLSENSDRLPNWCAASRVGKLEAKKPYLDVVCHPPRTVVKLSGYISDSFSKGNSQTFACSECAEVVPFSQLSLQWALCAPVESVRGRGGNAL